MPEVISARDNPGTLREFETVLILRPDTLQEGVLELNNKIKSLIEEDEGRMLLVENWGKRRLAYEIRKQLKGIYMYYQFLGHSQLIKEMERNFRLSESVIRYFTTRIDDNIDPDARPEAISDEDFLAASSTRPDEEELATGYVMTGTGEKIPVSRLGYEKPGEAKVTPAAATPAVAPSAEAAPAVAPAPEVPKAETKVEAPSAEAAPAEAPSAEAAPAVAPAPEVPKAETKVVAPKVETKVVAPKVETPKAETKVVAPKVETPKVVAPKVETPKAETKVVAPKVVAPKVETPKVETPKAEAKDEAPKAETEADAPAETPDTSDDKEEA